MLENIRNAVLLISAVIGVDGIALARANAQQIDPVQHEFVIPNFQTESGPMLPQAHVIYGTYGQLNAAADNAVLLPSHFMAEMHGYEWLIGPGKALDPTKLFIVATELFGNGRSSSPSNTPEPFHGPRFPSMTIRDNVDVVHRLLVEQLHIGRVRAVIGFSMGAQQAFQCSARSSRQRKWKPGKPNYRFAHRISWYRPNAAWWAIYT